MSYSVITVSEEIYEIDRKTHFKRHSLPIKSITDSGLVSLFTENNGGKLLAKLVGSLVQP